MLIIITLRIYIVIVVKYKNVCKFCDKRCKTTRGLKIHMAAYNNQHTLTEEEFVISDINSTFGTMTNRWYRVAGGVGGSSRRRFVGTGAIAAKTGL